VSRDDQLFDDWVQSLETQYLSDLSFAEVSRALRALSATYVERRERLSKGAALAGEGKRAAFALFYGPLHHLTVREIVRALPGALDGGRTLVDLGCGTGAAGAAWAANCRERPRVVGVDRHPWALDQASRTYRHFGLKARLQRSDAASVQWSRPASIVAAFTVNELSKADRDVLFQHLIGRRSPADRVLIVEPLARFVAPWWREWADAFARCGGRADEWRFRVALPPVVAKLDRAAGLDHNEITARSLWLPPR